MATMHRNLAKMTARFAGPCNNSPCANRIEIGDTFYFSTATKAFCLACGAEEAKSRSKYALAKKADKARKRSAAEQERELFAYILAHDTLPEWFIADRPSREEAEGWFERLRERAQRMPETVRQPCSCEKCKAAA